MTALVRHAHDEQLGLFEHLFDPQVDQTGLDLEFVGQIGDRLLPCQMPSDNLGLLFR